MSDIYADCRSEGVDRHYIHPFMGKFMTLVGVSKSFLLDIFNKKLGNFLLFLFRLVSFPFGFEISPSCQKIYSIKRTNAILVPTKDTLKTLFFFIFNSVGYICLFFPDNFLSLKSSTNDKKKPRDSYPSLPT